MSNQQQPPETVGINEALWEFPCDYDLKVMGLSIHPLIEIVVEIAEKHVEVVYRDRLTIKESRNGKYLSVTLPLYLTHKQQVEQLYLELNARTEVTWTL